MPAYHSMSPEKTLIVLQTTELGITEEEAEKRKVLYGKNVVDNKKRGGAIRLFLGQFKDFMTILLICAAVISGTIAYLTADAHELADTGILLFIILLNTVVGFIQQYRADNAVEKLKKLSVCYVKAVRGGKDIIISNDELVPGDVIYLEEGDMVPADCRLLHAQDLQCDESALTGESNAVEKVTGCSEERASIGDRKSMVYSSSFVIRGQAKAVVVETGRNTEIGKIAGMLAETKPLKTPLEKILATLGRVITIFVISVAAIIFIFGIFFKDSTLLGNFMSSVAIAVAAIPEGMPAIVTVIMALGVQRMSKEKAIIRKLHAVETLGGCSCICTDKTGTLTENRMSVERVIIDFSNPSKESKLGAKEADSSNTNFCRMLECMQRCNTVKKNDHRRMGDPTEVALVRFAESYHLSKEGMLLGSIPFSSDRKMMSVAVKTKEGNYTYAKGGADVILNKCRYLQENGKIREMTQADRNNIAKSISDLASQALRVLGFAYAEYQGKIIEEDLIFIGICGLIDPPKKGVKEAVDMCKRAGIRPVMITGDHRDTAYAIAKRLGIASSENQVLTGAELDALEENEAEARIDQTQVFARVSPKHKSLIVEKYQKSGNVVAMTGDGINDAPGIRKADIGIAMGISGTDVTRSAADMVIADDNFSTIVSAIREGRHIFSNIKKTIQFFLATNLAEVLSILIVTLVLWRYDFLTSTQLLWINLITDSLPVLSLGAEQAERDSMDRPPQKTSSIFCFESMLSVTFYGVAQTVLCIGAFVWGIRIYGNTIAVTMTFFVLSFLELFHSFNIRSEHNSIFGKGFFSNKMLFVTVFVGIVINVMLSLFAPLRSAFNIEWLNLRQWGTVFAVSLAIIPIAEIYKAIVRMAKKHRKRQCRTGFSLRSKCGEMEPLK